MEKKKPLTPIALACTTDDTYAQHATVMLASVLLNLAKDSSIRIYVLYTSLNNLSRRNIVSAARLHPHATILFKRVAKSVFNGFLTKGHLPIATYIRLALPDVLPHESRILYIDCDMIVERDITSLFSLPNDKSISVYATRLCDPFAWSYYASSLGIPSTNGYFNAGLMLLNLSNVRKTNAMAKVKQFLLANGTKLIACDQDGLNAVFWDRWKEIDPRWNQDTGLYIAKSYRYTTYTKEQFEKTKRDPFVIHFTDVDKPWHRGSIHPLAGRYYAYLRKTVYRNFHPQGTLGDAVKKHVLALGYTMVRVIPDSWYDRMVPFLRMLYQAVRKSIYGKKTN